MRLFFDLNLGRFVSGPGTNDFFREMSLVRGDLVSISIQFVRGLSVVELSGDAAGRIGIKPEGVFDGGLLAGADSWVKTGEGESAEYLFALNLNTVPLNELLGVGEAPDLPRVRANFELEFTDSGLRTSSNKISCTIENDVVRDTDGTPEEMPTPDDFVAERAVLHDREQELSDESQARARDNIFADVQPVVANRAPVGGYEFTGEFGGTVLLALMPLGGPPNPAMQVSLIYDAELEGDDLAVEDETSTATNRVFRFRELGSGDDFGDLLADINPHLISYEVELRVRDEDVSKAFYEFLTEPVLVFALADVPAALGQRFIWAAAIRSWRAWSVSPVALWEEEAYPTWAQPQTIAWRDRLRLAQNSGAQTFILDAGADFDEGGEPVLRLPAGMWNVTVTGSRGDNDYVALRVEPGSMLTVANHRDDEGAIEVRDSGDSGLVTLDLPGQSASLLPVGGAFAVMIIPAGVDISFPGRSGPLASLGGGGLQTFLGDLGTAGNFAAAGQAEFPNQTLANGSRAVTRDLGPELIARTCVRSSAGLTYTATTPNDGTTNSTYGGMSVSVTATSGSTAHLRNSAANGGMWARPGQRTTGGDSGIDFSAVWDLVIDFTWSAASNSSLPAETECYIKFGASRTDSAHAPAAQKQVGVMVSGTNLYAWVHSGSAQTTGTTVLLALTGSSYTVNEIRIRCLGNGTFGFYVNGVLMDTLSGGPTGGSGSDGTSLALSALQTATAARGATFVILPNWRLIHRFL